MQGSCDSGKKGDTVTGITLAPSEGNQHVPRYVIGTHVRLGKPCPSW